MQSHIFAVDIGGSKLICGVVTPQGDILDTYREELAPGYRVGELLQRIQSGFAHLRHHTLTACCAAIPGLADPHEGTWRYSPFSGIADVPIAKELMMLTGLPTSIDNDVNLSALAERRYGCCQNTEDFLWITVSNGIGGGLLLNGRLYRGAGMTAGEIGHVTVEEQSGRSCGCGKRGCLEAMASGASIAAIYRERTGKHLSAKEIAARAQAGEDAALRVWQAAGGYIGKAAAHAVNLLGLDTVVLGGGAAQAFDLLAPAAEASLRRFVFQGAHPAVRLCHSSLGPYASLLGCAALAAEKT